MTFEFDAAEEITGGGSYLEEAGTYHLAVNNVWEGSGPKGGVIQGFTIGFQVLAGTVPDQEQKELNLVFFNPNLGHSEAAQRIAKQAQTAFVIATGLISPADLGKRVSIDLQKAVGQQVIATLSINDYNDQKRLQLHYSNVFHVDDPRAKNFPKHADSIAILPTECRKGDSYFEPLNASKKSAGVQANSTGGMSQDDLNDL